MAQTQPSTTVSSSHRLLPLLFTQEPVTSSSIKSTCEYLGRTSNTWLAPVLSSHVLSPPSSSSTLEQYEYVPLDGFQQSRLPENTAVKVHEPDGKHTPDSIFAALARSAHLRIRVQKMTSNGAFGLGTGPFGHPIPSPTHRLTVGILFLAKP
ncbi:hypothetical protein CSAL01_08503 [Colletotrichum salicis]|uniref:Uncharacterized protein n=1 Tax=Colletotrichum salicis TaxID=1209931 RepID=A0A135S9J0_9PEZI|nr:hypothetical protein CSAL01_08503 [Colletotrichum salicis]